MEIWKNIQEDTRYQISNLGGVRRKSFKSKNRHGFYIKKPYVKKHSTNRQGYHVVNIGGNVRLIHRLIAIAFIPNPKKYDCINHIDGCKTNNSIENLEWCDRKHNNIHAYQTGLKQGYFKGIKGYDNPSSKEVFKFDSEGNLISKYGSASEAARMNKLSQPSISRCSRGERKMYKGFIWKYNTLDK